MKRARGYPFASGFFDANGWGARRRKMTFLGQVALAIAGGWLMYFGVGGAFELLYYRRRRARPDDWKCQPRRFPPRRMRVLEILLGAGNLTAASVASGCFAWWITHSGRDATAVYFDLARHGLAFSVATTIVYFLA